MPEIANGPPCTQGFFAVFAVKAKTSQYGTKERRKSVRRGATWRGICRSRFQSDNMSPVGITAVLAAVPRSIESASLLSEHKDSEQDGEGRAIARIYQEIHC